MSYYDDRVDFDVLQGKILTKITNNSDNIWFETEDGEEYKMYHEQDCCESVSVEDITGNLDDLLNTPIIHAYESTNRGSDTYGSVTWTFYNIATVKGQVTIRWHGSSNGYYSESVDFVKVK